MLRRLAVCWNNRGTDTSLCVSLGTPKDDMSSELCAQLTVSGERQLGETLENRAFPARLVSHNNKLRQVDISSKITSKELVDLVQQHWVTKPLARQL
jgi:protein-disulfide isomerase-like protein with CxxC motif